jgi:hypothetical protein
VMIRSSKVCTGRWLIGLAMMNDEKPNRMVEKETDSMKSDDINSPENKKATPKGSIEADKDIIQIEKQKHAMMAKKSVRGSVNHLKKDINKTSMPKIHTFKDLSHLSYFGTSNIKKYSTNNFNDDLGSSPIRELTNEELS